MGPDDKRAELDKIARAQAINKAAAEKAAKEKEKADAQAAKDKDRADSAPKAQTTKRGGEVALPTLPDEDSGKEQEQQGEIERDLAEARDGRRRGAPAAGEARRRQVHRQAADGRVRLEEEQGLGRRRQGARRPARGREAEGRPGEGERQEGRRRQPAALRGQGAPDAGDPRQARDARVGQARDRVDARAGSSDAGAAAAEARRRNHPRRPGRRAGRAPGVPARKTAVATPPPPVRTSTVATRSPAGRRQAAPADGNWNDPFTSGPKKTVAARETHGDDSGADDLDGLSATPRRKAAPASRGTRGSGDDDGNAKATGGTRRAAPAAKPKWKDPFTESEAPAPAHPVHPGWPPASRRPRRRRASLPSGTWPSGTRPPRPPMPRASGRWGVLKKHAH